MEVVVLSKVVIKRDEEFVVWEFIEVFDSDGEDDEMVFIDVFGLVIKEDDNMLEIMRDILVFDVVRIDFLVVSSMIFIFLVVLLFERLKGFKILVNLENIVKFKEKFNVKFFSLKIVCKVVDMEGNVIKNKEDFFEVWRKFVFKCKECKNEMCK